MTTSDDVCILPFVYSYFFLPSGGILTYSFEAPDTFEPTSTTIPCSRAYGGQGRVSVLNSFNFRHTTYPDSRGQGAQGNWSAQTLIPKSYRRMVPRQRFSSYSSHFPLGLEAQPVCPPSRVLHRSNLPSERLFGDITSE